MNEDIQVFVVESSADFVASITVDDNNVADSNLTGDGVGDLIVQFVDSVSGVGGDSVKSKRSSGCRFHTSAFGFICRRQICIDL